MDIGTGSEIRVHVLNREQDLLLEMTIIITHWLTG